MRPSSEKKIELLLQKKSKIEDKIKVMKKEEKEKLKELKNKRYAILGKFIDKKIKKGESLEFHSTKDIADFLDPLLKKKSDRKLFDLPDKKNSSI